MRIVQIFPGKVWGGAEQYVLDLGRALAAQGHDVSYICRPAEAVTARLDAEGVAYELIEPGGFFSARFPVRRLAELTKDADVVHVHDSKFVVPVSRALNRAGRGGALVFTRHIARGSRVMPWHRKCYSRLGAMIFVSDLSRNLWSDANRWMPQAKMHTVHNSIPDRNDTLASGEGVRERFGIAADSVLFAFTGRVRESKGCGLIVEALATLPKEKRWDMVFIGTGKPADYPARLEEAAAKAGIEVRVHFYGHSPHARGLIAEADVGLQPSIVREAFGLSQLEFMQAGKPVVTTTNGAQREYIDTGRNGILVPPTVAALAEAMNELLTDAELRDRIGRRAASDYSSRMNYEKFLKRITTIYESL